MARPQHPLAQSAGWRETAIGLTTSAAGAAAVAVAHILVTAQRGVICGATSSGVGHCWACYAAPFLALAAVTAWRQASLRVSPARARDA